MKPYYQHGGVTIYNADCREIASSLQYDAVVSDPPYGMNANTDSTRFSGGKSEKWRYREQGVVRPPIVGDAEPFDPTRWLDVEHVVLWGSNHYAALLPVGTTFVWLKTPDDQFGAFLSDCEIAWRKGGHGVYAYRKLFPPPSRMAEIGGRNCPHPTQKPLGLMRWCIERSGAPEEAVILDPYCGTGTTLRAAKDLGRQAIGIEIEERYCEIAAQRLSQEVLPL